MSNSISVVLALVVIVGVGPTAQAVEDPDNRTVVTRDLGNGSQSPVDPDTLDGMLGDSYELELPGDSLFPEGVAYDARCGALFAGNLVRRAIQRIGTDGLVNDFVEPGALQLMNVIGLAYDTERRRLWVASSDFEAILEGREARRPEVLVLDGESAELLARFEAPGEGVGFLNDIALDNRGNAYITDSMTSSILRVPADLSEVAILRRDTLFSVRDGAFNLNGIAVTPDQRYLIASVPMPGASRLFRVELDGSEAHDITLNGEEFMGGDGILFDQTGRLITVNGGLQRIRLADEYTSALVETLDTGSVNLDFPTTAVLSHRGLVIANSQLDHWVPMFQAARNGEPPNLPFTLTVIDYDEND